MRTNLCSNGCVKIKNEVNEDHNFWSNGHVQIKKNKSM